MKGKGKFLSGLLYLGCITEGLIRLCSPCIQFAWAQQVSLQHTSRAIKLWTHHFGFLSLSMLDPWGSFPASPEMDLLIADCQAV